MKNTYNFPFPLSKTTTSRHSFKQNAPKLNGKSPKVESEDDDGICGIPAISIMAGGTSCGDQDIENRRLYLYGEVDDAICQELIDAIFKINAIDAELEAAAEEERLNDLIENVNRIAAEHEDPQEAKEAVEAYLATLEDDDDIPIDAAPNSPRARAAALAQKRNNRDPIYLYISTPGGSMADGAPLTDAIRLSETPIITVNIGYWYSMGLLIGMCGHYRIAMPSSTFLLHDGAIEAANSAGKFEDQVSFLTKLVDWSRHLVIQQTKMSPEEYDRVKRIELYMFPEEAKARGFIDAIVGEDIDFSDLF